MSHFRLVLLAVVALALASAAVVTWRQHRRGSPVYSLRQLADAARARDRAAVERYFDVGRTAESVVDEALSTAAALDAGATPELQSFEGMRSSMAALVELNIWTTLLDPAAPQREDAALDLRTLIDRYQGIAGVQQRGDLALVGVRLGRADRDSAVIVHLRMEPAAGHWRIVGVEDLGPYLRISFGQKLERAYEAAMRSDLRNLATAQQMYFAEHASYSPSLEALAYSPSPGVRLEIIAASGSGWRAVARHETGTAECRIGVGTGVPPGDVEREVQCSAPRRRESR